MGAPYIYIYDISRLRVKLLYVLYERYININYFLLTTDCSTLPSLQECVHRFTEILSKLNNKKQKKKNIREIISKGGKIVKILKQSCKPVARVQHAARDIVFSYSHRLL